MNGSLKGREHLIRLLSKLYGIRLTTLSVLLIVEEPHIPERMEEHNGTILSNCWFLMLKQK